MEFLNYLLKVSACSALFFAFYILVLNKLTFFKFNRFYLLITLLLSFLIPALHFNIEREIEASSIIDVPTVATNEIQLAPIFNEPITITETSSPIKESFDWLFLLPYCYGLIVVTLLFLAIWRLAQLIKHARKNTREINGLKLVSKSIGFTNCSFFNYVFIDEQNLTEMELKVLLSHEEVHAKKYHSIDKIVLIVAKAVLWFNPIVYLYDKALEQIHEYEADEVTSQNFGAAPYANLLLRLAVAKSNMPLVHNFVKSPIKERIKMLFNSKTKDMKKLIYLLALPIGLGLLWGFTVDVVEVFPKDNKINEKEFTLVLDAGHGGKESGAIINSFKEKDITLAFTNKIKAIAEAKGIKVITTRESDKEVSLKDRLIPKGDFFLSIHVNSEPIKSGGLRNGIELYTPTSDKKLNWYKSTSMSYNLYQNLKTVAGIKTNNKPFQKKLFVLQNSVAPGLVLEMGYLTNTQDLKTITNDAKQVELAEAIVDAVERYKKYIQTDEEIKLNFKDETLQSPPIPIGEDIKKWEAATKNGVNAYITTSITKTNGEIVYAYKPVYHAFGYEVNKARYANSKIKTIQKNTDGTIARIVLNDKGFTINLNITDQKFESKEFKVGDSVVVKFFGEKLIAKNTYGTDKMIVLYSWPKKYELKNEKLFDKFYFEDGRQKVAVIKSINVSDVKVENRLYSKSGIPKPTLVSATKLTADTKNNVNYIKNGVITFGNETIEAEEMIFDKTNLTLKSPHASIKYKDGTFIVGGNLFYDFKNIKYTIKRANISSPAILNKPEVSTVQKKIETQIFPQLAKNERLDYKAKDSIRTNKLTSEIYLYGSAEAWNEKILYKGDMMIYNVNQQTLKVKNNATIYDKSLKSYAKADSINMNLKNSKGMLYGGVYFMK